MRRFLFAVLLTLLLCVPAFAMKNEPDGFRRIRWGDKVSQHWDLRWKDGDSYYRLGENRYLPGDVFIVDYHMHKTEGFYWADVSTIGEEPTQLLKKECLNQWGAPHRVEEDSGAQVLVWIWANIDARMTDVGDAGLLSITDNSRYLRTVKRR